MKNGDNPSPVSSLVHHIATDIFTNRRSIGANSSVSTGELEIFETLAKQALTAVIFSLRDGRGSTVSRGDTAAIMWSLKRNFRIVAERNGEYLISV